jgi:pimeloyl-ACP methyl ester carboxylesterase
MGEGIDESASTALTALGAPTRPHAATIEAAGIRFHVACWDEYTAAPVLLIHGVASSARTWWRIGPAIAAAGFRVVAPDLPGHGLTGGWTGHHRFRDNARDVAAVARAALPGVDPAAVAVVGHSWGAMTAAALPAAGYVAERLVLLDPPAIPLEIIRQMLEDPTERAYDDLDEAIRAVGGLYPTWPHGDVLAKAEALTQLDEAAVRAVLTENGDWDGGLADLAHPAAREVPVWLIRGDPAFGGLVPDQALPALAARVGADHVATIRGAPHSPQRTHPVETLRALLRALTGRDATAVGAGP